MNVSMCMDGNNAGLFLPTPNSQLSSQVGVVTTGPGLEYHPVTFGGGDPGEPAEGGGAADPSSSSSSSSSIRKVHAGDDDELPGKSTLERSGLGPPRVRQKMVYVADGVHASRVLHSATWCMILKPLVYSSAENKTTRELYERWLPFLNTLPLPENQADSSVPYEVPPVNGDRTLVHTAMHGLRYSLARGLESRARGAHVELLLYWQMLRMLQQDANELVAKDWTQTDAVLLRHACRAILTFASRHARRFTAEEAGTTNEQLQQLHTEAEALLSQVSEMTHSIQEVSLKRQCATATSLPPRLQLTSGTGKSATTACSFDAFPFGGRLQEEVDDVSLAGDVPPPPIFRPCSESM